MKKILLLFLKYLLTLTATVILIQIYDYFSPYDISEFGKGIIFGAVCYYFADKIMLLIVRFVKWKK